MIAYTDHHLRRPIISIARPAVVWFRNDLRLADNPALEAAAKSGPIVALFVFDEDTDGLRDIGGAAKWWLDKSLRALAADIEARGGRLVIRRGPALDEVVGFAAEIGASSVYWNRRYGAAERDLDAKIKDDLKAAGVSAESFNGSLLTEPWTVTTNTGGFYRVFTPYWKAVRASYAPPARIGAPDAFSAPAAGSLSIDELGLHPTAPDWSGGFVDEWSPGEAGAAARLQAFLDGPVSGYGAHRNRPDLVQSTSRLSPHLRFGEISPAAIWRAVHDRIEAGEADADSAWVFLSEIVWREFSYVLLFHSDDLAGENYNRAFDHMPWRNDDAGYEAWTRGQTGYPIVDAGMRELWRTGWMHNRVRMIVASFLTKHLLIDWRRGEDWFWDTLVDADPASNAASWQWTAGSGADAAPYFRVFNPITQGQKFDETGAYVRKWVPELAALPDKFLHAPWQAPASVLETAGVVLGGSYPRPIIDHAEGRARALAAYDIIKERRAAA